MAAMRLHDVSRAIHCPPGIDCAALAFGNQMEATRMKAWMCDIRSEPDLCARLGYQFIFSVEDSYFQELSLLCYLRLLYHLYSVIESRMHVEGFATLVRATLFSRLGIF